MQRTIDQLRVEGLLITRPGSGTFVRGTRRRLSRLSRGRYGTRRGYHADLAARYRQVLTEVATVPAPAEVTEAFGVPDGTPLVVRRHLVPDGVVRRRLAHSALHCGSRFSMNARVPSLESSVWSTRSR